jgi:hypothetical protein
MAAVGEESLDIDRAILSCGSLVFDRHGSQGRAPRRVAEDRT